MQFEDVLNKRYSVRKFDGRKVEKEKIDAILNAARMAPTAKNNQPQRIFVLESGDALEKLKKARFIISTRRWRFSSVMTTRSVGRGLSTAKTAARSTPSL